MEMSGHLHAPDALAPSENLGPQWISWLDLRACKHGFVEEKIYCPHRNSKPGPSSSWLVSTPTALSGLYNLYVYSKQF